MFRKHIYFRAFIMLFVFSAGALAVENDYRTFGDTALELVLSGDDGEIDFNRLDGLSASDRANLLTEFKVIRLRGRNCLDDGFYILNGDGSVEKYIRASVCTGALVASANGDRYLRTTGPISNFNLTPMHPVKKELVAIDGRTLWQHEMIGYPSASDGLSVVAVYNPRYGAEDVPNLSIMYESGLITEKYFSGIGQAYVSRDGETILIAGSPFYETVTHVLDNRGKFLFDLDPAYYCGVGTGLTGGLILYASDKYIIQACAELDKPGSYVQVYSSNGDILWQESLGAKTYPIRFAVSDNDDYLMVYTPKPSPHFEVLKTLSGEAVRRVNIDPGQTGDYFAGGVSNDGSKCFVVFIKYIDGNTFESRALLYYRDSMAVEFRNEFDQCDLETGAYGIELSEKGDFAVITSGGNFRLYEFRVGR